VIASPLAAPAIHASGLTKIFGNETAVADVSFQLPPRKILAVIGPSGCGKTTTLRLSIGIYNPSSGDVTLMGRRPATFTSAARREIGYMPQLFVLYPQLTVWENLSFAASMYGMSLRGRKKRMQEVLEFVDLDKHAAKLARNISGGMQRRLSLAATLIHDPQYIFLDEPTAGIDPVLRRRFWDHFVQLREQGRTLFVTTQYVGEAAYCDLVAVMAKGRLLMVEPPDKLRKRAFAGEIVNYRSTTPVTLEQVAEVQRMPFVHAKIDIQSPTALRIIVDEASTAMPQLMRWSGERGIAIEAIEEYVPPFDDVFVELLRRAEREQAQAEAQA
jgi:ABC-2 type transport system ATP-binding protein